MTYVICRLTAKNLDELRNPTFGSRVWAASRQPLSNVDCLEVKREVIRTVLCCFAYDSCAQSYAPA